MVVILNSGGGTVTGYGLAAALLARVKNANLGTVTYINPLLRTSIAIYDMK